MKNKVLIEKLSALPDDLDVEISVLSREKYLNSLCRSVIAVKKQRNGRIKGKEVISLICFKSLSAENKLKGLERKIKMDDTFYSRLSDNRQPKIPCNPASDFADFGSMTFNSNTQEQ